MRYTFGSSSNWSPFLQALRAWLSSLRYLRASAEPSVGRFSPVSMARASRELFKRWPLRSRPHMLAKAQPVAPNPSFHADALRLAAPACARG